MGRYDEQVQISDVTISVSVNCSSLFSIKIIPSIHHTFGYDILIQGKQFIHQPNIPALPGNEGFATRKRARKVAEFVVRKIRKNEMPPTVTVEDLNKMDVLN